MKTYFGATLLAVACAGTSSANLLRSLGGNSNTLVASFDFDDLQATVTLKQSDSNRQEGSAKWKVVVDHWNDDLCPGGQLNWHIHETPGTGIRDVSAGATNTGNAVGCGKDDTGGHYDPTFACGAASQNRANGLCDAIDDTLGDSYDCSTDEQYNCEIGDQSGKLGKIDAQNCNKQKFIDNWINDIASIEGRSLVLHCCDSTTCGPRLACANLEIA